MPMDLAVFLAFCISFFLIAISPGLCMTLAMSLGISVGVRRALWMMWGELVGIALVGAAAIGGVSTLLLNAPTTFTFAKLIGALYLLWSAFRAWNASVDIRSQPNGRRATAGELISQGFLTSISNPKAWVFFAALLPPFIDPKKAILPQAGLLLTAMVVIEFVCLLLYAQGGRLLSDYLSNRGLDHWLNRVAATLMVAVAIWLILS